jgi:uncharacterized membrane protein YhaH (DUF805 family)
MRFLRWVFSSQGRIRRRQFWTCCSLCLLANVGATVFTPMRPQTDLTVLVSLCFWSILGGSIFVLGAIRRSRDVGNSGWYVLIPFYTPWLLFVPGQVGPNRFGPDPRSPQAVV